MSESDATRLALLESEVEALGKQVHSANQEKASAADLLSLKESITSLDEKTDKLSRLDMGIKVFLGLAVVLGIANLAQVPHVARLVHKLLGTEAAMTAAISDTTQADGLRSATHSAVNEYLVSATSILPEKIKKVLAENSAYAFMESVSFKPPEPQENTEVVPADAETNSLIVADCIGEMPPRPTAELLNQRIAENCDDAALISASTPRDDPAEHEYAVITRTTHHNVLRVAVRAWEFSSNPNSRRPTKSYKQISTFGRSHIEFFMDGRPLFLKRETLTSADEAYPAALFCSELPQLAEGISVGDAPHFRTFKVRQTTGYPSNLLVYLHILVTSTPTETGSPPQSCTAVDR